MTGDSKRETKAVQSSSKTANADVKLKEQKEPTLVEPESRMIDGKTPIGFWIDRTATFFSSFGTIVALLGLGYVVIQDFSDEASTTRRETADRKVMSALNKNPKAACSIDELAIETMLNADDLSKSLSQLGESGLLVRRSNGSYSLATTEYLETSATLRESTLELTKRVQEIQTEIADIERHRNELIQQTNTTYENIERLQGEQTKLYQQVVSQGKSGTKMYASMLKIQESADKTLRANQEILSQSLGSIDDPENITNAMNILFNRFKPSVDKADHEFLTRIWKQQLQDMTDVAKLYKILHKHFPNDFEVPSKDPFSSLRTPEMRLLYVLSQNQMYSPAPPQPNQNVYGR